MNAYAARHAEVADDLVSAPTHLGGAPGTTTVSTTSSTTSTPVPLTGSPASAAAAAGDFTAMPATDLDEAGLPAALTGFERVGGWHNTEGVWDVVYRKGPILVSVYEEQGQVDWSTLPRTGAMTHVGADDAWALDPQGGALKIMVIERGMAVYTVVAPDQVDVASLVIAMPRPSASMMDRARRASQSFVGHFGFNS